MNTNKQRITKTVMGISFSLLLAVSGTVAVAPQSAHAAVASKASVADHIISTGKQYMNVRYLHGADAGRTDAFDCSSFTQYVFKQNGIELPRSSRQQSKVGKVVKKSELQPGDLVFSDTDRDGTINHVSIYMGNGKLLHTYKVGIGVTISDFKGSIWDETFVTARDVIGGDRQSNTDSQTPVKETPKPAKEPAPAVEQPSYNDSYTPPYYQDRDRNRNDQSDSGNQRETRNPYDWFNQFFNNLY
ncbi:C40 family peptidase [Paenibacillus allorhizosphaerae]|uniref:NlpC/P60 domain-containing protein n=1 Tax=Paenibacillus allorhizosphaerae TaxID=2849866 RepID=A0ABM8VD73_9BACL|nr:hypothetical protein PAECIP111802_01271 [Paenibacillus allorhizosphaerae]